MRIMYGWIWFADLQYHTINNWLMYLSITMYVLIIAVKFQVTYSQNKHA